MGAIERFREARQKFEVDLQKEIADSTWTQILPAIDKIQELTNRIEATTKWARVEIFKK